MLQHAVYLGMDPDTDQKYFYLARQALKEGMENYPEWEPNEAEDGAVFYYNVETGESAWDLPVDIEYRKRFEDMKAADAAKAAKANSAADSSSGGAATRGGGPPPITTTSKCFT